MTLAENVRDYAIFLMDADGIIRYWGEGARLMKWWTSEQVEGSHLRVLYPDGGSEDGTAEDHLRTASSLGEYTGEGCRVRNDGSTFWAGVTLTALKDDDGVLLGFVKVTRDFSARRAVEASLARAQGAEHSQHAAEEANRLKTLFLAGVSHEMRTPLNTLLGYLDILAAQTAAVEAAQPLIARMRRSGQHLREIVNDVLDSSRLDAGQMPVSLESGQIAEPVEAAIAEAQWQADARNLTLINAMSGSARELPYFGDPGRVRQIIENLLANAIKFTPAGGRVVVSAGTAERAAAEMTGPGPWVYVRVEDTGIGIPADRLEEVFEPFRQVRASDAQTGSGLGLTVARRLARLMGGDLTVTSDAGVGSQFMLWLAVAATSPTVPR